MTTFSEPALWPLSAPGLRKRCRGLNGRCGRFLVAFGGYAAVLVWLAAGLGALLFGLVRLKFKARGLSDTRVDPPSAMRLDPPSAMRPVEGTAAGVARG